jgi:hypothetical protein
MQAHHAARLKAGRHAHSIVFAPEALDDLRRSYELIADASLPAPPALVDVAHEARS